METSAMLRRRMHKESGIPAYVKEGHVYVLELSNGIVKIGRTNGIELRMQALLREMRPATIARSWFSPRHWKYGVNEQWLLKHYHPRCEFFCGEYFKGLSFDDVVSVAETMPFKREPGFMVFEEYLQKMEA